MMGLSRVVGVCAVLVALAVVSGCGSDQRPAATPSSPVASSPVVPSESPAGTPSAPETSNQPDKGDIVELRGTVEAGVEPGCLILQTAGKTYGLYGGDPQVLKAGARVAVRGVPKPDMVTTCQQGIPFEVTEVRKL